jgi:hypothetical protein
MFIVSLSSTIRAVRTGGTLVVLAVEGFVVFSVIVVALVMIARAYDGQCGGIIMIPGFSSATHPCSFFEHMSHYWTMAAWMVLLISLSFWWVSVPILILAVLVPVIAYKIAGRRAG